MASNPPDPHQICFWPSPRLAVSSVGLEGLLVRPLAFQLGDLPLMHAAFCLRRLFFFESHQGEAQLVSKPN
eukprot:66438-Pelagomonas_calceolata.AAC.1